MILVIDTNIVFSALLNPESIFAEILINSKEDINLFAPDFLIEEIEKYSEKILKYSKLDISSLIILKSTLYGLITFVETDKIASQYWEESFKFLQDIDPKDTPFLALAMQMQAKVWTGDKKLLAGLHSHLRDTYFVKTDELKAKLLQ